MREKPEMAMGTEAVACFAHQAASAWEGAGLGTSEGHLAPAGQWSENHWRPL